MRWRAGSAGGLRLVLGDRTAVAGGLTVARGLAVAGWFGEAGGLGGAGGLGPEALEGRKFRDRRINKRRKRVAAADNLYIRSVLSMRDEFRNNMAKMGSSLRLVAFGGWFDIIVISCR
jgi:hypothetical protein